MSPAEAKAAKRVADLTTHALDSPLAPLAAKAGRLASDLAATMAAIHGGKWSILICHDTKFVSVRWRSPL